jgi:hypothetical protein
MANSKAGRALTLSVFRGHYRPRAVGLLKRLPGQTTRCFTLLGLASDRCPPHPEVHFHARLQACTVAYCTYTIAPSRSYHNHSRTQRASRAGLRSSHLSWTRLHQGLVIYNIKNSYLTQRLPQGNPNPLSWPLALLCHPAAALPGHVAYIPVGFPVPAAASGSRLIPPLCSCPLDPWRSRHHLLTSRAPVLRHKQTSSPHRSQLPSSRQKHGRPITACSSRSTVLAPGCLRTVAAPEPAPPKGRVAAPDHLPTSRAAAPATSPTPRGVALSRAAKATHAPCQGTPLGSIVLLRRDCCSSCMHHQL